MKKKILELIKLIFVIANESKVMLLVIYDNPNRNPNHFQYENMKRKMSVLIYFSSLLIIIYHAWQLKDKIPLKIIKDKRLNSV